jgi:hypothetical protein
MTVQAGRTPEEHRAATAAVMALLPANDCDVFSRRRASETPKLSHLSGELAVLLQWRRQAQPSSPYRGAWLAPDDAEYVDGKHPARDPDGELECRPEIDELLTAIEGVVIESKGGRLVPVDGDIEYGEPVPPSRPSRAP